MSFHIHRKKVESPDKGHVSALSRRKVYLTKP